MFYLRTAISAHAYPAGYLIPLTKVGELAREGCLVRLELVLELSLVGLELVLELPLVRLELVLKLPLVRLELSWEGGWGLRWCRGGSFSCRSPLRIVHRDGWEGRRLRSRD